MKLTKTNVSKLPHPENGQKFYWDDQLPGFGIRVSKKKKTYIVQRDVKGRSVRYSIGSHPVWSADTARNEALGILKKMMEGINPNNQKKQAQRGQLGKLFERYLSEKSGKIKQTTELVYRNYYKNHLLDWDKKDIRAIKRDDVIKKFKKISEVSGRTNANNVMQMLRAMYNFAQADDLDLHNPVTVLSKKGLWNEKVRRKGIIQNHQLSAWSEAVCALSNDSFRDAFLMMLFTGMRKSEVFKLTWENVDFQARVVCVPNPKNKMPFSVPLTDRVYKLLKVRHDDKQSEIWVFGGGGQAGHIVSATQAVKFVQKSSGVKFILHDLRRTFVTTGHKLQISPYTLKALLNHKQSGDITASYVQIDIDLMREASQLITDELDSLLHSSVNAHTS